MSSRKGQIANATPVHDSDDWEKIISKVDNTTTIISNNVFAIVYVKLEDNGMGKIVPHLYIPYCYVLHGKTGMGYMKNFLFNLRKYALEKRPDLRLTFREVISYALATLLTKMGGQLADDTTTDITFRRPFAHVHVQQSWSLPKEEPDVAQRT